MHTVLKIAFCPSVCTKVRTGEWYRAFLGKSSTSQGVNHRDGYKFKESVPVSAVGASKVITIQLALLDLQLPLLSVVDAGPLHGRSGQSVHDPRGPVGGRSTWSS